VNIPASISVPVQASHPSDYIALLGEGPGVYAFVSGDSVIHLAWSTSLVRRIAKLSSPAGTSEKSLVDRLHGSGLTLQCWPTASKLESSILLYELSRRSFPLDYRRRLRLQTPWFVSLTALGNFPRLTVANKIQSPTLPAVGPFRTRELAQQFEQDIVGAFLLRRCTEQLAPEAQHPGCIYGEIHQCLRPCQAAVTPNQYEEEANRASNFLSEGGGETLAWLSAVRDQAAADNDFETAGQLHRRYEKLKAAREYKRDPVRNVHDFNGIALTWSRAKTCIQVWPMLKGFWQEPVTFAPQDAPISIGQLEHHLYEKLSPMVAQPALAGDREEHLAVFSRWYYSSWREGSWHAFTELRRSDCRKLARQILQVIANAE
jgi:excinuclease ABC subunit C